MNIHNPGTKMPEHEYSPIWTNSTLSLPKDRATINAWARSAYALDPDVSRIVDQHVLLISGVYQLVDCKSKKADQFIGHQLDLLGIKSVIEKIIQEYYVLGEVFVYSELNESDAIWQRCIIQNPDYILVKQQVMTEPQIFMRPDENLRRLALSISEKDAEDQSLLSPIIVKHIKNRENIPLDPFYVWHMAHKISPYEIRGTSFIVPIFETIGGMLTTRSNLSEEKRKIISQSLGDIAAFDKPGIATHIQLTRYSSIIDSLEFWINEKLIKPIAKINDLHEMLNGEKTLVYPKVKFNRTKLQKLMKH